MRVTRGRHGAAPTPAPVEEPRELTAAEHRLAELAHDVMDSAAVQHAMEAVVAEPEHHLAAQLVRAGGSETAIAELLADVHGTPSVELRATTPEPAAVALVDEAVARRFTALPLSVDGDAVTIAFADPTDSAAVSEQIHRPVVAVVAPASEVRRAIEGAYRALTAVDSQLREFEARDSLRREAALLDQVNVNEGAPVVQVAQMVITQGLRDRASDIHIEPSEDCVRVRYRVDGALHDVLALPASIGPALVSRVKIMAGLNIVERRRPQDGQIALQLDGHDVDIRVSTTAVVGGEKVVLRLLDKSRPLFALTELGMPKDVAAQYTALLRSPYGMVICAGPTGSGKTTTLYASLTEVNTPERNIMTIEDPVEYTFPTINQIQINEQAGITFANGLRSILRQDPDIILVGEVRDADTARIAVQSALTGHFVLSSLHATDSVSALHRLLDMGIEAFLVTSAVTAVVAQRLVRRVCAYCKESHAPSREELAFLEQTGAEVDPSAFVHGAGCNFCAQTGFLERIGVYELLTVDDALRDLILDRGSHEQLRKLAAANGMQSLQDQALALVRSGVTTITEAMRTIYVAGG